MIGVISIDDAMAVALLRQLLARERFSIIPDVQPVICVAIIPHVVQDCEFAGRVELIDGELKVSFVCVGVIMSWNGHSCRRVRSSIFQAQRH